MRHLCLACVVFAFPAILLAQDPPKLTPKAKGIEGIWEGPLKAGAIELRLAFKVSKDKDGKLTATMDSIDQGAKGIPVDEIVFADRKLTMNLSKLKAKYTGEISDDETTIKGHFDQSGMKMELVLKRVDKISTVNRPQHPKKPYPYATEDVTYENPTGKFNLAGTLTLPKGDGPFPAVVLVSGSGPQDRDETLLGHKPFLVIADHLTRHGVAVLRFDDRGVAKSGGKHEGATSADFATDAHAGVAYLKTRKEIDPKRIGLMGHSEGGLIAPMVAADHPDDVGFIVLLAGPGVPGDEVLKRQQAEILKAMGEKPETIKLTGRLMDAIMPVAKQPGPADERKKKLATAVKDFVATLSKEEVKLLGADTSGMPDTTAARLGDPWMSFFLAFDPRPTLGKVKCPVLAVNGELDLQVIPDQNVPAIEKTLAAGGNKRVTTKVFPKLNHLFQHTKAGLPSEYGQIEETFAPEVIEFITDWLRNLK
jgi:uncharacterized protein